MSIGPTFAKPEPTPAPKAPIDPERGMTNTIKNWITERRENSKAEKTSNDRKNFNWPPLPETANKTA